MSDRVVGCGDLFFFFGGHQLVFRLGLPPCLLVVGVFAGSSKQISSRQNQVDEKNIHRVLLETQKPTESEKLVGVHCRAHILCKVKDESFRLM